MERVIFLWLLLAFIGNQSVKSQNYPYSKVEKWNKQKKVIKYEGDKVIGITEYNSKGKMIYNYQSQKFNMNSDLYMVSGFVYDKNNKLIKIYYLHSNTGVSISHYEYDEFGNQIRCYNQSDFFENRNPTNSNRFQEIAEIKSLAQIESSPRVKELESKGEKRIMYMNEHDSLGNVIKHSVITQRLNSSEEEKNRVSFVAEFEYNADNIMISEKVSSPIYDDRTTEVYFDSQIARNTEMSASDEDNSKLNFILLQSVKVKHDIVNGQRKRTVDLSLYEYKDRSLLISQTIYSNGIFSRKYGYKYDDKNRKIEETFSEVPGEVSYRVTYEYNDRGNILVETKYVYDKVDKQYGYEYEYYD